MGINWITLALLVSGKCSCGFYKRIWCLSCCLDCVAQVRDKFGARVIFPASGDEQPDVVTIIGKKESVEQAKEHILEQIKELVST